MLKQQSHTSPYTKSWEGRKPSIKKQQTLKLTDRELQQLRALTRIYGKNALQESVFDELEF